MCLWYCGVARSRCYKLLRKAIRVNKASAKLHEKYSCVLQQLDQTASSEQCSSMPVGVFDSGARLESALSAICQITTVGKLMSRLCCDPLHSEVNA